jgi:hypothetical protein
MCDLLHGGLQLAASKRRQPSVGIIDSQSRQDREKRGPATYGAHKRVKGRRRHLPVDMPKPISAS